MKGIDIASYQDDIDFKKVKNSAIEIVYIKATEGINYNNPLMKSQYNRAKAEGLKIGFYHFLRSNNPIIEAKHFLSVIEGLSADCKYVIDVEETLGQTITQISSNVRQFADYLISNGKEVCIYTGDSFYLNNLNNSVKNIPLWVAHYGVAKPDATNYIGFQYTSSGNIEGIIGLVDLDEFSSDIFINLKEASVIPSKPLNPPKTVNLVLKTFQHTVNLIGLTDKNGNKLVEDGNIGTHTNEVISKVLQTRGAKNEFVRWIQQRLITLKFSCGKSGADANFGWNTFVAIQHFQVLRGLKPDGVVGPATILQLLK
ncbi:GH25 family lysozyme [Clostridium sp.]|uniref:GH25 family lysozyme n=1 Tax=Clostridium sp. TaxID=1506 RepID=UPI001A42ABB1|nr:GH25 family lysozyme [Clostridium sp.]MBK5235536.1 peptidoglycan-binding protein [Clostridium sp.]